MNKSKEPYNEPGVAGSAQAPAPIPAVIPPQPHVPVPNTVPQQPIPNQQSPVDQRDKNSISSPSFTPIFLDEEEEVFRCSSVSFQQSSSSSSSSSSSPSSGKKKISTFSSCAPGYRKNVNVPAVFPYFIQDCEKGVLVAAQSGVNCLDINVEITGKILQVTIDYDPLSTQQRVDFALELKEQDLKGFVSATNHLATSFQVEVECDNKHYWAPEMEWTHGVFDKTSRILTPDGYVEKKSDWTYIWIPKKALSSSRVGMFKK